MKRKIFNVFLVLLLSIIIIPNFYLKFNCCFAVDTSKNYYTIYENTDKSKVLFLKGDEVQVGDKYLSHDNKLYEIESVDKNSKTAIAKFLSDEKLPEFKITKKDSKVASAASRKKVGVYHTHNDESYYTPDGFDSVYGKGGIHDIGKELVKNFNELGIETVYREDLHLPHNSGAYQRSQVTASAILSDGVDAIFDIHRDSTKRSEYLTKVDGEQMSAIRMVIGSASINYEENKNFAYTIKAYADKIYPGLIKDIYIGKGNYNQQLSTRAMLFEMGCENIEKDLVKKSTKYLAKVLDVVLYGTSNASEASLQDVSVQDGSTIVGLTSSASAGGSNETLFVVVSMFAISLLVLLLFVIFSKNTRYKVGRFFSETFAGIFGKKKAR